MEQRHLVGAAAGDMPVERVVAGVDDPTGKPAAVRSRGGIEDPLGRLDPVDLARRLGPKALGIPERAGVDLVIAAVATDVHGVAPAVESPPSIRHGRARPGHPRLCKPRGRKDVDARPEAGHDGAGWPPPCSRPWHAKRPRVNPSRPPNLLP